MHVGYDKHARKRMRERQVNEAQVEATLRHYDTQLPGEWGRINRYKIIEGRRIRVTFDQDSTDDYYVWTVTADEVEK